MAGSPIAAPSSPHTSQDVIGALAQMGIQSGDHVLLHSSYRSLGAVEGGPEAVLNAFLELIGPGGNLMLPTFNYTSPLPEPCYDPALTPCRTGVLCELGRSKGLRSLHPTHSVAVIGPDAEELTKGHLQGRAFGPGSPIDRMARRGGKILLLGVGQVANSTIHVGEEYAMIPKSTARTDALPPVKVRIPTGELIEHKLDSSPSCSAAFGGLEAFLREHDEIVDGRLGACLIQSMSGMAVLSRTENLLRKNPRALLCRNPQCGSCRGMETNISLLKL